MIADIKVPSILILKCEDKKKQINEWNELFFHTFFKPELVPFSIVTTPTPFIEYITTIFFFNCIMVPCTNIVTFKCVMVHEPNLPIYYCNLI